MTTATPEPATPSQAWSDLKHGEWAFRRGLLDDTELRAAGDHAEADRISSLRGWYATQRAQARGEQAFDRLNPGFGVPADTRDPLGHQAVQQREAGLALGVRVAVAASRENDPTPVLAIAREDYRAADAARHAPRARPGPERGGPER
jgi:hypothetical protein